MQHRRVTAASMYQNGISRNTKLMDQGVLLNRVEYNVHYIGMVTDYIVQR